MARQILSVIILFTVAMSLSAQTTFVNGVLNSRGEVLLESKTSTRRYGEIKTLYHGDIESDTWSVVTTFPEYLKMVGPPEERFFFLYNRFGLFKSNSLLNNMEAVKGFPEFADYQMLGSLYAIEPSPDGRYVLYYRPTSAATGDLMLLDINTQSSEVVIKDQPLSTKNPVVKWSPDSRYFIYEQGYQLYYYALGQTRVAAHFRHLGPGTLSSIEWHRDGSLYYVLDSRIFRFRPSQIFIGTLYRSVFNTELIVGYLFTSFRPTLDKFLISNSKDHVAVMRKEGTLFIQELQKNAGDSQQHVMPLITFSDNESVIYSGWTVEDNLNIISNTSVPGSKTSILYNLTKEQDHWSITQTPAINAIKEVRLAPSGRHLAMIDAEGKVLLYSTRNTERPLVVNDSDYYISAAWASPAQLILGGAKKIENMDLQGRRSFIAVSQALTYGFLEAEEEYPYVRTEENEVLYIIEGSWWRQQGSMLEVIPPVAENINYNIRFAESSSIVFANQPLIINRVTGTRRVPFDFRNNISRQLYGGRVNTGNKVALSVDFTQTNIGFFEIMDALNTNNVNATLFINGDFLQRYPTLSRVLAYSRYEKASLFSAYLDFAELPYRVTLNYIKQNLKQVEENYKIVTADNLKKMWHAPYYYTNDVVRNSAQQTEYTVVEPDFYLSQYIGNNFSSETIRVASSGGSSLVQLINAVASNVESGDIIAFNGSLPYATITTGYQAYMYSNIEILIKALQNKGFDIVSVSELEKY